MELRQAATPAARRRDRGWPRARTDMDGTGVVSGGVTCRKRGSRTPRRRAPCRPSLFASGSTAGWWCGRRRSRRTRAGRTARCNPRRTRCSSRRSPPAKAQELRSGGGRWRRCWAEKSVRWKEAGEMRRE
eukprot:1816033-Rhodomonas_salina.1